MEQDEDVVLSAYRLDWWARVDIWGHKLFQGTECAKYDLANVSPDRECPLLCMISGSLNTLAIFNERGRTKGHGRVGREGKGKGSRSDYTPG